MDKYSNTISLIRERRTAVPRYRCTIRGRIALSSGETNCTVLDISTGGLGLAVDAVVRLANGQKVIVTAPELGSLRCTVQWVTPSRAGLSFIPYCNDLSHVNALIAQFEKQRINQTE